MAEDETTEVDETEQNGGGGSTGGGGARTAVKAAAAAAATGAAAMAVRKALASSNGKSKNGSTESGSSERSQKGGKSTGSLLTSVASGGWEAARDALLPLAEDAAGAAGTYLAQNGPDVVRDKIVPKFISSFNEARESD
jgi:hypothetical protein